MATTILLLLLIYITCIECNARITGSVESPNLEFKLNNDTLSQIFKKPVSTADEDEMKYIALTFYPSLFTDVSELGLNTDSEMRCTSKRNDTCYWVADSQEDDDEDQPILTNPPFRPPLSQYRHPKDTRPIGETLPRERVPETLPRERVPETLPRERVPGPLPRDRVHGPLRREAEPLRREAAPLRREAAPLRREAAPRSHIPASTFGRRPATRPRGSRNRNSRDSGHSDSDMCCSAERAWITPRQLYEGPAGYHVLQYGGLYQGYVGILSCSVETCEGRCRKGYTAMSFLVFDATFSNLEMRSFDVPTYCLCH